MAFTLIKNTTTINFTGMRRYAYAFSLMIIALGIIAVIMNGGIRYGVDFAGGVTVQIQFEKAVPDEDVKKALANINLPGLTVQQTGTDNQSYLLRFSATEEGETENLRADLTAALKNSLPDNPASIERMERVGPRVGADLRNMAVEALFYSVLLISVYISGRFEHTWVIAGILAAMMWGVVWLVGWAGYSKVWGVGIALLLTMAATWKLKLNFALGTTVSLVHDVFTTMALLMMLGKEIDLNIIAALLTLVGYSLNDTIIVFDRIRENLRNIPASLSKEQMPPMSEVINLSINQTLSRTLLTSGTTLLACLSLYFLGGTVIHDFALTITIGVVIGTYSSIFVASPILMAFGDVSLYRSNTLKNVEVYERPGEHGVV